MKLSLPLRARLLPTALVALACLVAAGGCGSSSGDSKQTGTGGGSAPAASADAKLRALLPADVRDAGELKVATSKYPPVDFFQKDGRTLTGFDHDIVQAIGQKLGLKVSWSVIDFASIVPGIQSKQYDFATDLNDTAEREQVVDFVTEFRDGTSILVEKGNGAIKTLDDLCGKTVLVTKGSTQIALVAKQTATCKGAGKAAVKVLEVPDDPDAMLAMRSGRADAYLVNTLAGSYAVAQGQAGFEVLPGVYDKVYAGFVFPKQASQLRDAVKAALQSLIDDGSYGAVMKRYGVSQNAITAAQVNVAAKSG